MSLLKKRPQYYESGFFGRLEFDKSAKSYSGNKTWQGQEVKIHFHDCSEAEIEVLLTKAKSLFEELGKWDIKARETSMVKLLELKNESWVEEDDDQVTGEQFKERLGLVSISLDPEGHLSFEYDDNDLFWGHWIDVSGDLENGLTDAQI